jgi:glyoxylase-like metal-dependent hydrolase (beta-lactamase superfamily II)
MGVRIFAMSCGWQTLPRGLLLEGETGSLRVPTPVYLIEHPRGRVVFDSGLHTDLLAGSERLGELARLFTIEFQPGDAVGAQLERLGIDPGHVDYLVSSHLHFDHVGGNAQIPNATWVVQRREWEAGCDADAAAANYFDRRDYDLGHALRLADGELDLFGDGAVTCLPTWGHTPGHQSLRVRSERGDVVLAADACYLRHTLEALHLPAVAHDREGMLEALRRLRALRDAGTRIFFGHDPEFWATLPQAPAAVL